MYVAVVLLFCFVLLVPLYGIKHKDIWLDLTNVNGGLPTSLMVNAPPNYSIVKDYSLQQINNDDNRTLNISCTQSIKRKGGMGGGGGGGQREREKKKGGGERGRKGINPNLSL